MDELFEKSLESYFNNTVPQPYSVNSALFYSTLLDADPNVDVREVMFWFDYSEKVNEKKCKFMPKTLEQWVKVKKIWEKVHNKV